MPVTRRWRLLLAAKCLMLTMFLLFVSADSFEFAVLVLQRCVGGPEAVGGHAAGRRREVS